MAAVVPPASCITTRDDVILGEDGEELKASGDGCHGEVAQLSYNDATPFSSPSALRTRPNTHNPLQAGPLEGLFLPALNAHTSASPRDCLQSRTALALSAWVRSALNTHAHAAHGR
jgi:hypothetical protein